MKLNDFVFGYQDFVVGLLPSLKRIDDLEVGNEEEKKRVNRIATIIGDQMLLWMKMMAKIKERLIVTLNGSPNKELIDMPSQMIQMINRLSSIYVVPTEENVFKKNINDLLAICLMAVETEDEVSVDDDIDSDLDYLASIRKTF